MATAVAVVASTAALHVSPWTDLVATWKPQDVSSCLRFSVGPPDCLEVLLIKHAGGNHNRIWEIRIGRRGQQQKPSELRIEPFHPDYLRWEDSPDIKFDRPLCRREFVASNDRLGWEAAARLWMKPTVNSWCFVSRQDLNDPDPGPIKIVPRNRNRLKEALGFRPLPQASSRSSPDTWNSCSLPQSARDFLNEAYR